MGAEDLLIRLENVTIGYSGVPILSDVNLRIARGVFLPFVGPNGSGKTTLLRTILGLHRPLAGLISTPFARRPPGYVAQQKSIDPLYPISVRDIVRMGLWPRRRELGRRAADAIVGDLLARLHLLDVADRTFAELSGGQRQRVMIARAFAADPEVLVMDEPTTELDETAQREVLDMLHRAVELEGRTVLLAHHGLDAIVGRAHQICLVKDGKVRIVPVQEAHF